MIHPKPLATGCSLLLLVLIVAVANSQPAGEFKNGPVETTGAPSVIQPANAGANAKPLTTGKPAIELNAPAASKVDIKVPAANTVAPQQAPDGPAKVTTVKPVVVNIKAPTNAPNPVAAVPAAKGPAPAATTATVPSANQAPDIKIAQYFEPICQHLDKLTGEHMFKIQAQMKLFIEKTAGKMSVCFMQHYMIDPNLSPVDKIQLRNICSSQTLAADSKGSFKNFQSCARNNWDKNLDVELDRIIKLRENCFFNHIHSKNDSTISLLHDEELTLIGEVVGKVLRDNNQATKGKPNITLINLGPTPASAAAAAAATKTTTSPVAGAGTGGPDKTAPLSANNQSAASKIMNDPNTLLVLVDDASATRVPAPVMVNANSAHRSPPPPPKVPAPPAPSSKPPVAAATPTTTQKPAAEVKLTIANSSATSARPAATVLSEKIISAATTNAPKPPAVTAGPKLASATNITVVISSTVKPLANSAASTTKPPATTMKPAAATETTTTARFSSTQAPVTTKNLETPTTKAFGATSSKLQTTPKAAASSIAPSITKQPEAAKSEKERKSKEGDQSEAKEGDQSKAKEAIKSLQKQRAGHVSDARLHQIEHERQMTIDPVGHTMKHKKYEEMKQQRTSTMGPASSAPTTKKP